jgi:hypothetical protein
MICAPRTREPMYHEVKSHTGMAFDAVWDGRKLHEVRVNDRNYREGDRVIMREFTGTALTGRWVQVDVLFVTYGPNWGLPSELCVFSFAMVARSSPEMQKP